MRRIIAIITAALLLSACGAPASGAVQDGAPDVLATIYPLYAAALNLLEGVEGVTVGMLAAPQSGCMHDYQLSTGDRIKVEQCGVLIINGLELEPFLDKIIAEKPDTVIVASEGYSALIEEHVHEEDDHDDDGHEHGEHNAHIWVSIEGMVHQTAAIAEGLMLRYPEHALAIAANLARYSADLSDLYSAMATALEPYAGQHIITVHNAFPYFAREFGLNIAAVVQREPGAAPSARELKEAADTARALNIRAIFTEPLYDGRSAETLAAETGLPLLTLDPVTTGAEGIKNGYIDAMERNLETLLLAFGDTP